VPDGRNRASRRRAERRRATLLVAALLAAVGVALGLLLDRGSSPSSHEPITTKALPPSAAERHASRSLVRAAEKVGFHAMTAQGTGVIESKPAAAARRPYSRYLLPVGSRAPVFSLRTPEGGAISLRRLRGKTVLLEFFATWCPQCNAEASHLERLYRSLPHSRFAFVSVNADSENAASVFAFHRFYGLTFPAVLDPGSKPGSFKSQGSAGTLTVHFGVKAYPTFYVIDTDGRVAWRSDGEQPDALLRQELERAR